ncbi:MAG: DNA polymerase III subunit alpha, partial [Deltaproteobacteria bacterium]|nr:DNA polymerase III subunit alpha [Deltaproteobacteria bacterium]
FSERLAVREVARAFGFTESDISRLVKNISQYLRNNNEKVSGKDILQEKSVRMLFSIARRINNNMRHISTHCGGIVISDSDIRMKAPVEITGGGRFVIQWDKDDIEELNIVKIDILGNRSLAVIRDAKDMIRKNYGIDIDAKRIIFEEDPLTLKLIKDGKTLGVFYIESPAMRQLQKKTGVSDFEHIVIHSSIIRPAANRYINEYVERLKGKPFRPLHPALTHLLSETYGIMCYQEDVMKVAMEVAGFSYEDADRLRKTLSKKQRAEKILYYREKFYDGGRKNGVDNNTLNEIWDMIESFGGYSFCKPHSASYAQVSFMSAYIKAHFPAEFIASVIKNKGGYYSVFAYISEAKRMGLNIYPPDINISEKGAVATGDSVWMGFEDIISFSEVASDMIIAERTKGGRYTSLEDFLRRNPDIGFADIRRLILSGAFDRTDGKSGRLELLLKAEMVKKWKNGILLKNYLPGNFNPPPYT